MSAVEIWGYPGQVQWNQKILELWLWKPEQSLNPGCQKVYQRSLDKSEFESKPTSLKNSLFI